MRPEAGQRCPFRGQYLGQPDESGCQLSIRSSCQQIDHIDVVSTCLKKPSTYHHFLPSPAAVLINFNEASYTEYIKEFFSLKNKHEHIRNPTSCQSHILATSCKWVTLGLSSSRTSSLANSATESLKSDWLCLDHTGSTGPAKHLLRTTHAQYGCR